MARTLAGRNRLMRDDTPGEGRLRMMAIGACTMAYFVILLLAYFLAGGFG